MPDAPRTSASNESASGAPAEIASRIGAFVSTPDRCHARHIDGTAGTTSAAWLRKISSITRGNGTGARWTGTPCSTSGSTTLENP